MLSQSIFHGFNNVLKTQLKTGELRHKNVSYKIKTLSSFWSQKNELNDVEFIDLHSYDIIHASKKPRNKNKKINFVFKLLTYHKLGFLVLP